VSVLYRLRAIAGLAAKSGGYLAQGMDTFTGTVIVSTFSGVASEATGGDFAEGAMTGAIVHLYNDLAVFNAELDLGVIGEFFEDESGIKPSGIAIGFAIQTPGGDNNEFGFDFLVTPEITPNEVPSAEIPSITVGYTEYFSSSATIKNSLSNSTTTSIGVYAGTTGGALHWDMNSNSILPVAATIKLGTPGAGFEYSMSRTYTAFN
jgi:hypothetical protein